MRRLAKWIGVVIASILSLFVFAIIFDMRPGNIDLYPIKMGELAIPVYVVSHGYHSGLVLRRSDLLRPAKAKNLQVLQGVLERFGAFDYLEFGWGDEGFYHHVRTINDLRIGEALRALFMPGNPSVMHVVGLYQGARQAFPFADIELLRLSETGFSRLVVMLDESFGRDAHVRAEEMGQGLYGPSLFYRANGTFSVFNVCNHWVARLLDAAGVPTNPVLSTLPPGLFLDLVWRAHAQTLPRFLNGGQTLLQPG